METIMIFAMNPRLKNSTTGKMIGKYHRGYAEPATAQQIVEMLGREDLRQLVSQIRNEGRDELKEQLPSLCPHYSQFKDNHRAQSDIIAESFTYKTCVDVDEVSLVEQAISRAQEVNGDELSDFEGMVEYIERSPRNKCHIWLRMPVGMTIEETQRAFCEEISVPYDESCTTPERFIYMTGDEVYRSERWLQPLSADEIEERREAFLMRGLDVDGRKFVEGNKAHGTNEADEPDKAHETNKANRTHEANSAHETNKAHGTNKANGAQSPVVAADDRTRFIVKECLNEAGLEVRDLNELGGIHNAVKSVLSVGATQLVTEGEFLGVMAELMPTYWEDKNFRRLVSDFYAKYTDENQKLTQFQRRVFAQSRRLGRATTTEKSATQADSEKGQKPTTVHGHSASLTDIYASSVPPVLPEKLPKLVRLVTSLTPDEMKANVAQGMFPPLGVYPRNLSFTYIDHLPRELRMNCLTIGETGGGKDTSLKLPLKHLTKPMADRDMVNRHRLQEFNEQYNTKAMNKEKPKRPEGLIIQYIRSDITCARLSQLMDDSQGAFLYTNMHEFEQWYGIEGVRGTNCTFKNLKLADDEDNPFGQERAGSQSVNYSGSLGLNWNASTTPAKAQYMFRFVMVDGPLSRLCLATTPKREIGSPIPVYGYYGEAYDKALAPYIENLEKASGELTCKQACKLVKRLKAECDQFSQQTQDELFDNLTHRALVHAFRKACLLYTANGMKWERLIEDFCRWSLHYDLWLKLHFFGDLIRQADSQTHTSHRGPRNLLHLLPQTFTRQEAVNVRLQQGKDSDGTCNMLAQWKKRGYITLTDDGCYTKVVKE